MSALRIVTVAWFAASVVMSVFGNLWLYVWLVRQGARPRFAYAGMPGHLDRVYSSVPAVLGFPG